MCQSCCSCCCCCVLCRCILIFHFTIPARLFRAFESRWGFEYHYLDSYPDPYADMSMTNNRSFRQQDLLEEMDRQRQQQRMQLMMQHHQQQQQFMNGVRPPVYPPMDSKPCSSLFSDLPNRDRPLFLRLQEQQQPATLNDQFSNAHVHQQMQQQQHYLYMQRQQQQLELANQRLRSQFMPPSVVFNGQLLPGNNTLLSGNNQAMARQQQQQQLKQSQEQQNMVCVC